MTQTIEWKTEPINLTLNEAAASCLLTDALFRTPGGAVWRKTYGASFERLTSPDGSKPLAKAKRFIR